MTKFSLWFLLLLCSFNIYAQNLQIEDDAFILSVNFPDIVGSNQSHTIQVAVISKLESPEIPIGNVLSYRFDPSQQDITATYPEISSSGSNEVAFDFSGVSSNITRFALIDFVTNTLTSPTLNIGVDVFFFNTEINSSLALSIPIPVEGIEPPEDEIDNLIEENSGEYVTTEVPYNNQSVNTHSCVEISQSEIGNSANCSCTTNKCKCPKPAGIATTTTGSNDDQAGDPVMLNSLEYVMNMIVMQMAGRGIDYEFAMTYRSRINFHGRLGRNWSFNYDMRVATDPDDSNTIILYNGMGRGDAYTLINGSFVSPEFHFKRIVQDD